MRMQNETWKLLGVLRLLYGQYFGCNGGKVLQGVRSPIFGDNLLV